MKDKEGALKNAQMGYDSFKEDAERLKLERIQSLTCEDLISNSRKANLISFLYYNYAYLIDKLGKSKESLLIFRKGYQFSMSILGENNLLTLKFKPKLYETIHSEKSKNNIKIINLLIFGF